MPFTRGRSGGGDRAQAVVVGAIVLFGFAVALLGVLQLQFVPAQVQGEELVHSDRIGEELVSVGTAQWDAATAGEVATTHVTVGLNYRDRFVLRNPHPARGRLALEPLGNLSVTNVTAVEAGGPAEQRGPFGPFPTAALVYTPDYDQYTGAPVTVVEPHVAYDRFADGATVVEAEWSFVDDTRITLVTVTGSLSSSGRLAEPVGVGPVSTPVSSLAVTDTGDGPLTLHVPTELSNERWAAILEPESVANGGHVVSHGVTDGVLTVVLESGVTYDLRLARVGIGPAQSPATEPATHVTVVSGGERTVPPNGSQLVVVEARDRFHNPVVGARVRADDSATVGTVASTSRLTSDPALGVTGENGRVSFLLTAPSGATANTTAVGFELD